MGNPRLFCEGLGFFILSHRNSHYLYKSSENQSFTTDLFMNKFNQMKIASAQIEAQIGDIKGNLEKHLEMINIAVQNDVDLIVFPEMSLSGYCREEGKALAMKASDEAVMKLQEMADAYNLVIIIGAPIEIDNKLFIGSYILRPNSMAKIYTKQYLHTGEDVYYSSSFDYNPTIVIKDEIIALAICADIDNFQHPKDAKKCACTLYMASIFFSTNGIDTGHELLAQYAKEYSFCVLMSNFSGELWDTEAGGRSAFWGKNGELVGELETDKKGLLVLEKRGGNWVKRVVG
jgi:predicted amidohydrolase